jgi:hypothetical protein
MMRSSHDHLHQPLPPSSDLTWLLTRSPVYLANEREQRRADGAIPGGRLPHRQHQPGAWCMVHGMVHDPWYEA